MGEGRLDEEDRRQAEINLKRNGYPTCHDQHIYCCRECGGCYACQHKIDVLKQEWTCQNGLRHQSYVVKTPVVEYDRTGKANILYYE